MKRRKWSFVVAFVSGSLLASMSIGLAAQSAKELSLQECVEQALSSSKLVKISLNEQAKSAWTLSEAKGLNGATIAFVHKESRFNPLLASGGGEDKYTNNFSNQLALTLPLYSGGKLEGQIKQAANKQSGASLALTETKQSVVLDAVVAYFTVLQYQETVEISRQMVENCNDHLNTALSKYDAGLVAKTDVLQTQVKLADAKDRLIIARNNYLNAVAMLNNLIGQPQGQNVKLSEVLTYEQMGLTLEEAIQKAMAGRVEIKQAMLDIGSAEQQIAVAKSGKLPQVVAGASNSWNSDKLPGDKNSNWQIQLTASLNLFDTGVVNSQINQAKYDLASGKERAQRVRENVELEVRQQYCSLREAEARIELSKAAVVQAEEDLAIYKTRYDAGVGTNLDVMDALVALATARNNAVRALYDYNTSKTRLEKAMGAIALQ